MFQNSIAVSGINELKDFLSTLKIREQVLKSKSALIQIFASEITETYLRQLNETIKMVIPFAIIVGATTSGEIVEGNSINKNLIISFSLFEEADLKVIAQKCPSGSECETGEDLSKKVREVSKDIKGLLLLATTQTIDGGRLLNGMREEFVDTLLFGAGAGSYDNNHNSYVFNGAELYTEGVVAVVFSGRDLNIEAYTYIGWQALSREMTVTEVANSLLIKKIDDVPAASIYERYLGIRNDDKFFENVIEFPIMLRRDDTDLARIPIACDSEGAMLFVADINEGEKVRISYGNPESIIINAYKIQKTMKMFAPEGIFLYTCNCRQIFLRETVQFETQPFEKIAPTTGFYTYGEFYGRGKKINLLNSTMVAVGIREGAAKAIDDPERAKIDDFQEPRRIELAARLVHFIEAVVAELEDTNAELQVLSDTDKLTQLYNRGKIDSLFQVEIEKVKRRETSLSIILMDIDQFKSVNDIHGHHAGDNVLKQIAETLKINIRNKDDVGRWGGEEFLILLRDTTPEMAYKMAERLRTVISETDFGEVGKITASFGTVSVNWDEDEIQVYKRVDAALYSAKNSGRNRVVCG